MPSPLKWTGRPTAWLWAALFCVCTLPSLARAQTPPAEPDAIRLRAWGVPSSFGVGPLSEAERLIIDAFRDDHPNIDPVSPTGLVIPGGSRTMDMVPFMQIAGDIAPDVMYVNFRQSHTYISKKLLHPLDRYIEASAGVTLPDGSAMSTEAYLRALSAGAGWPVIDNRVPAQCWPVLRRRCPHGEECPYRKAWSLPPLADHKHVWAYPVGPLVMGLVYDRTLFAEHAKDGVEQRAPRDWDEMIRWAKALTNPEENEFGLELIVEYPGWQFLNFLYSAGGRVVEENEQGDWYCTLDTDEAVEAAWYFARLRWEKVEKNGKTFRGVLAAGVSGASGPVRYGMSFRYLDDRFLGEAQDQTKGFGPVPAGPTGKRGSEFNAKMCGIYAGLADQPARRDAAWAYLSFYDGPEARRISTEKMVEAGLGRFVRPSLLTMFNEDGRYDAILRQVPAELVETYRLAFEGGVPEPYGKNCQYVYDEVNKPLGAVWASQEVIDAIDAGNPEAGKAVIRHILREGTERINHKMLGHLPPQEQKMRERISWGVIAAVVVVFVWVFWRVGRTFAPPEGIAGPRHGGTKGKIAAPASNSAPSSLRASVPSAFSKRSYLWAYLLLLPGVFSILLWSYWPMVRGTAIAFQDYSVLGDGAWVGSANFAAVLWDREFWISLRISLVYGLMFMLLGFCAPIALALLLQEVPRGSIVFRTLFYLPAVLSGVVVIFLWKSFYAPDGLINQMLNSGVWLLNLLPGMAVEPFRKNLLENPAMALFFCLLPTVWAGMGPGCLIYLAALKTIPEELYEAADIDGAGIRQKVFRVALPSIKTLVMINFIGAMIGAIRGSGGFILAMTGGGPYGQSGGATEVVGLKLFYTTFGHLNFGVGAAMAWVVGSMLIGFTVLQLQRLSRVEFKAAGGT